MSIPVCTSRCNGCSATVNTVNVCNVVVLHLQRLTTRNFALSTYRVYLAKPLEDKDDVHAKATMQLRELERCRYILNCDWSFQKMPTNTYFFEQTPPSNSGRPRIVAAQSEALERNKRHPPIVAAGSKHGSAHVFE